MKSISLFARNSINYGVMPCLKATAVFPNGYLSDSSHKQVTLPLVGNIPKNEYTSDYVSKWGYISDFTEGSPKYSAGTSANGKFTVGSAIISEFSFSLNNYNDKFTGLDFRGAYLQVNVGAVKVAYQNYLATEASTGDNDMEHVIATEAGDAMSSEYDRVNTSLGVEWLYLGTFYFVEHKTVGKVINCSTYDLMKFFDEYMILADDNITFPCKAGELVRTICNNRGIPLANSEFDGYDTILQVAPQQDITERQALSYICQITGNYARMGVLPSTSLDRLIIDWYDVNSTLTSNRRFSHSIETNDVVITGVTVNASNTKSTTTESKKATYTYPEGADSASGKYLVVLNSNPWIVDTDEETGTTSNLEEIAKHVASKVVGLTLCPGTESIFTDISIEPGDVLRVQTDNGDGYVNFIVTNLSMSLGTTETITCDAEAADQTDLRQTQIESAIDFAKSETGKKLTAYQTMANMFARLAKESLGLYEITKTGDDGSTIAYYASAPTLEEVNHGIVWTITRSAIQCCEDYVYGDDEWNAAHLSAGVTVDGMALLQTLTAVGINADWIQAGAIQITDVDNNETFYADTQTGIVRIRANSFSLQGKTIDEVIDENNEEQNKQTQKLVDEVKAEADKKIQVFYQKTAPTEGMSNNDLWINTDTKEMFRYDEATKQWGSVQDNDIAQAIADAKGAQDTADSKITCSASDTPPEGISTGDLWIVTADYTFSDTDKTVAKSGTLWRYDAANKEDAFGGWAYWRDSTIDEAVSAYDKQLNQDKVFAKLTNNDKNQGIYLEKGKLYINAEYIATGIIRGHVNSDGTYTNWWNLDTGEFHLSSNTTIGPGNSKLATREDLNATIKKVTVQYAISTSDTQAPTSGWDISVAEVKLGQFLWQRTRTETADGVITYSTPTCVNMDRLASFSTQYYLSNSNTTRTGGSWSTTQTWSSGKYVWTRTRYVWNDGSITYSDPVLADTINLPAQEVESVRAELKATNDAINAEVSSRRNASNKDVYLVAAGPTIADLLGNDWVFAYYYNGTPEDNKSYLTTYLNNLYIDLDTGNLWLYNQGWSRYYVEVLRKALVSVKDTTGVIRVYSREYAPSGTGYTEGSIWVDYSSYTNASNTSVKRYDVYQYANSTWVKLSDSMKEFNARIAVTENKISLSVSESDMESYVDKKVSSISIDPSSIRLQTTSLSWSSTYSSLTSDGVLTVTSATIAGFTIRQGQQTYNPDENQWHYVGPAIYYGKTTPHDATSGVCIQNDDFSIGPIITNQTSDRMGFRVTTGGNFKLQGNGVRITNTEIAYLSPNNSWLGSTLTSVGICSWQLYITDNINSPGSSNYVWMGAGNSSMVADFKGGVAIEGNCQANSFNGQTVSSDRRLKKNIKELKYNDASKVIMSLKPVTFQFKGDKFRKGTYHGFIAQDVAKLKPQRDWNIAHLEKNNLIEGKEKSYCLDYKQLIADLVSVVQQQEKRICELETKIKA